jgi:two-component system, NarL family, sensor kinase
MEVSHQADIVFFLVTGMIVLLLLAVSIILFFRLYTRKILRQQAQLLREETRHQEELLFSTISSVEAERKRIATDIHDEIGSIFSTLSIFVNRSNAGVNTNPGSETARESLALIEKGMVTVRRIAHTMMPHELEMFGLVYTVENLCEKLHAGGSIDTSFHCSNGSLNTTAQIDLAVYRVLQELTSNTIKHAQARHISIHLSEAAGSLRLLYTDDGKGLDISGMSNAKGLGLKNIESRVSMVKGKITYSSAPAQGITCVVEIPLTQQNVTT